MEHSPTTLEGRQEERATNSIKCLTFHMLVLQMWLFRHGSLIPIFRSSGSEHSLPRYFRMFAHCFLNEQEETSSSSWSQALY